MKAKMLLIILVAILAAGVTFHISSSDHEPKCLMKLMESGKQRNLQNQS